MSSHSMYRCHEDIPFSLGEEDAAHMMMNMMTADD